MNVQTQGELGPVGTVIVLIIALALIALWIWVLYFLYSSQKAVPPQHQKMQPGLVWLLLIPLFNLVWNFFVFLQIPESYQSYFASQGRPDIGRQERTIGLWFAICSAASLIPCVGSFTGLASLVLLIIFLVKLNTLRKMIGSAPGGGFAVMPPPPMSPPPPAPPAV